jgi:hypothetical protein
MKTIATMANGTASATSHSGPPSCAVAGAVTKAPLIAMTTANKVQAKMSSTAAHARARVPVAVWCMFRSVRIRARTGKAVTDMAAPMNIANGQK